VRKQLTIIIFRCHAHSFVKVPRPDTKPDDLGLKVLDEPTATQSDATVLELRLRAISKKTHGGE